MYDVKGEGMGDHELWCGVLRGEGVEHGYDGECAGWVWGMCGYVLWCV